MYFKIFEPPLNSHLRTLGGAGCINYHWKGLSETVQTS